MAWVAGVQPARAMSSSRYQVRRFEDVASFREHAVRWLLEREAEHNLLLGLLPMLETSAIRFEPPVLLATVDAGGEVQGCVFRTPPYKLGLTRFPLEAMPAVVAEVARTYESLPAVLGPPDEARRFVDLWCARHGRQPREGMQQRIFQLDKAIPPQRSVPGQLRLASMTDLDRLVDWMLAFSADAGTELHDVRALTEERIEADTLFVWEDGEPVCMAGYSGQTPHGVRIGFVYTPPALRRRGYATACVASLSERTLRSGRRFCFLYTDLGNPSSNRIYQRIGYRPVCDVIDVHL